MRWFPIMGGPPIPWSAMAPHEAQAASNHGQTLERLAERGGLSPGEAVAVMSGRRWRRMSDADASSELARLVAEYEGRASVRLHQLREDIERDRSVRNIGVGLAMVGAYAAGRRPPSEQSVANILTRAVLDAMDEVAAGGVMTDLHSGRLLVAELKRQDVRLTELARRLGSTYQVVYRWTQGRFSEPNQRRAAEALGLPEDFFSREPPPEPPPPAIDPSTVALDVARAAHAHVCDLTIRLLSPACEGPWLPQGADIDASLRSTQIYLTVRDLAAYALEGAPLDAPVHEYLVSLIPLWSATCGGGTTEIDGIVEREPTTDLGRVIALAVARETLDQGRPITAYQLATLGGITVQHARRLVAGGELGTPGVGGHGEGHAIGAVEARAWLARRNRAMALALEETAAERRSR